MRRSLLLFLVLALLTAACGGGDDGGGGGGGGGGAGGDGAVVDPGRCPVAALEDATGPVEIDFWHGMTAANEETLQALVEEYNGSQDRVRVKPAYQGTYDEISDKYITAQRGGDLPALVQLEETRIQFMIDSRTALPAQACVDADGYDLSDHLEPVVEQFTVDDVLWPMPFNVSNPILYYNSKAFEAAGLTAEDAPETFEELRSVSQTLVDSGVVNHGFAIELSPWYVEQWFAKANEPFVDNDNGRSDRATEVLLDNPTGLEIYEFLDGMLDDGLAMNVGRNPGGQDAFIALATEDAAMTIGTSAALGSILQVLATGQFPNVGAGVAPLPGSDEGGVLVGGAALWLIEKGTSGEEKAAAWDFARWLNEPEQQATWHAGTGYIPIRRSAVELPAVAEKWQTNPEFRVAYDQLLASEADFGGPVIGAYAQVRDEIVASLERLFLQGQEPAEAISSAKRAADEEIQSYNDRVG